MVRNILHAVLLVAAGTASAQPVPKAIVAEYFTNSYCSVCAGRNPGFFQNLSQHPQVLEVSYYPSSPYASCPINQYNKPEADARTQFYGVYGATPRLVLQGTAVPANANYSSASLFQPYLNETAAFSLQLQLTPTSTSNALVRLVLRKVAAATQDSVGIYAAILQDTLFFAANNGETKHYNVFRRAVWGLNPIRVPAPQSVGDSLVLTQSVVIDPALPAGRLYCLAVAQQLNREIIQATRSGLLAMPTGIPEPSDFVFTVVPNPVQDVVTLRTRLGVAVQVEVLTMSGTVCQTASLRDGASLSLAALPAGTYLARLQAGTFRKSILLVKQ